MPMPARRAGQPISAAAIAVALVACFATAPATAAMVAPTSDLLGAAEATPTAELLRLMNQARVGAGLLALRSDRQLGDLASKRARWMADRRELGHETYGGELGEAVSSTGLPWLLVGENVGMLSARPAKEIAPALFDAWRASDSHWDLMRSHDFNYVGVGVALTATGDPYATLVFAEMLDRTAPRAAMSAGSASGRTITWRWSGDDVGLQTHTAGLCSFDVHYRDGTAAWRLIRSRTTSGSLVLRNRLPGHRYAVRVRARDCRGNVSAWTTPRTVKV